MNIRWPFRRRAKVVVIPAPMSREAYRAMCLGEEVTLLAGQALSQAKYLPYAVQCVLYVTDDGRQFEVSVAVRGNLRAVEEPRRTQ